VKPTNKEKKKKKLVRTVLKVRCLAIGIKRHNKNAACHGHWRIVLSTVVKLPLCLHLCSKCNRSVNVANKSDKNSSCHKFLMKGLGLLNLLAFEMSKGHFAPSN